MAIDGPFLGKIVEIATREKLFPAGNVLILGDCNFVTDWSTGDNVTDRERFREIFGLKRVETVDAFGTPSILMDLSNEPPQTLRGQFDLVIDAGTLYNCFDIASVFKNCFEMMKDKSVIIHHSALTGYFGRAYYNLHPSLFNDLFEQNKFVITDMEIRVFKTASLLARLQRGWSRLKGLPFGNYKPIDPHATFLNYADLVDMAFGTDAEPAAAMLPNDALVLCAARRTKRCDFVRPLPSFYRS